MPHQAITQPGGIAPGLLYQRFDASIAGIQQRQQQMAGLELVVPMPHGQGLGIRHGVLQLGGELVETHSLSSIGVTARSDAPLDPVNVS